MTWFYLAASSVALFTALNLLQRKLALESKNQRAMAIVFNVIAACVALVISLFTGTFRNFSLPSSAGAWATLLLATLFYGIFERGRFYAAKLLDASVLTIIINISVVVAFIGSLLVYSEPLTTQKLLGSVLIFSALLLVAYKRKRTDVSLRGLLIGVVISIFLGLGWILDKRGAQNFGADVYNVFIWILPIAIIALPRVAMANIVVEFRQASWKVVILAVLNVIGYLFQLKALEIAEATRVIPIVQTSIMLTVLLGILVLKEREHIPQKLVAGLLAFLGVYFLV